MQLGLERILVAGGYGAYSTHFGAVAEDGRFARLPLAAASSLMAKGYGFSAEGDGLTAALMSAAQNLIGETQFTEMYAMDFARDAFLMSHMGEGNWALAREDEPVRLIKRPLGIGGLDDPPTFLFRYRVGAATLATLVALGDERFRLVVSEGEILDTDELPGLEMPYGFFRPGQRLRRCIDGWLRVGGTAPPGAEPRAAGGGVAAVRRGRRDRGRARLMAPLVGSPRGPLPRPWSSQSHGRAHGLLRWSRPPRGDRSVRHARRRPASRWSHRAPIGRIRRRRDDSPRTAARRRVPAVGAIRRRRAP